MKPGGHDPVERRGLVYPHGAWVPDAGTMVEAWPGIFWVRMPLPFGLDHINLWVLDGGDHWVIVDSGVALPVVKEHWRTLFAGPMAGKPVGRIIVTHYHPDHIGLAGWLAKKWGVTLEITRAEFMLARVLTLDMGDAPPAEAVEFYRRHGWPDDALLRMQQGGWGMFGRAVHRLPIGYKRLRDGDRLAIGGRRWDIVVGSGHSPEHACLYCADERLLISGDQVLPRITSNVSVYPTEPDADPLGDWLDSIERFHALDRATRVFPAHNEIFEGLHVRLDQLGDDHHAKLDALEAACTTRPITAWDSFGTLFRKPVPAGDYQMATGEAVAHLNWLHQRGRILAEGTAFVAQG